MVTPRTTEEQMLDEAATQINEHIERIRRGNTSVWPDSGVLSECLTKLNGLSKLKFLGKTEGASLFVEISKALDCGEPGTVGFDEKKREKLFAQAIETIDSLMSGETLEEYRLLQAESIVRLVVAGIETYRARVLAIMSVR